MGADKQDTVFERFSYTMDGNTTGLGLPICKELAEQMGGTVYMTSGTGKGTTMWIVIPCKMVSTEKRSSLITNGVKE